jgi:Rha family phage regulatory protein
MNLPKMCLELGIRAESGVAITDSLAVCRTFTDKRHDHVLRDIESLVSHSPKLGSEHWFRKTTYISGRGRSEPVYEMTRDGFVLLVMGWIGPRALEFKIQYIEAFNAMEAALNAPDNSSLRAEAAEAIAMLRDLTKSLPVRLDDKITSIDQKLDQLIEKSAQVDNTVVEIRRHQIDRSRVKFSKEDKKVMRLVNRLAFHGRCPVSGEVILNDDGEVIVGAAEYDHFNGPNNGGPQNGWLIAKRIHTAITTGEITRQGLQSYFEVYQDKLKHIWKPRIIDFPNQQLSLFADLNDNRRRK